MTDERPIHAFLSLTAVLAAGCSQPGLPTSPTAGHASTTASGVFTSPGSSEVATDRTATVATPFKGRFEGPYSGSGAPPVITVHVQATGNASHLGGFTLDSTHDVDFRDLS